MPEKMELSSDGGNSGSKKCKRDYGDACGESLASVAVKIFSRLI
jgi:hypothetical protein